MLPLKGKNTVFSQLKPTSNQQLRRWFVNQTLPAALLDQASDRTVCRHITVSQRCDNGASSFKAFQEEHSIVSVKKNTLLAASVYKTKYEAMRVHFSKLASSLTCNYSFLMWCWLRAATAACNSSPSLDLAEERSPRWDNGEAESRPVFLPQNSLAVPQQTTAMSPSLLIRCIFNEMTQKQQTSTVWFSISWDRFSRRVTKLWRRPPYCRRPRDQAGVFLPSPTFDLRSTEGCWLCQQSGAFGAVTLSRCQLKVSRIKTATGRFIFTRGPSCLISHSHKVKQQFYHPSSSVSLFHLPSLCDSIHA